MGNHALDLNPPNADYHLSTHGSDWLWAAFSVFALSLLVMIGFDFMRPRGTRLFHQLAVIILTTLSVSYFSMASDLGATPIQVEFRGEGTRQIFYVRYIQWFITFPLLLLELLLATGLSLSDIMTTLFMGVVVVIMGLIGALVHSDYKWGYYTFGCAALFYVWYTLLWHAPRAAFAEATGLKRAYLTSAGWLSFMLITYPIAWACAEGGNVISVTSEMIWYGILDILAGPGFLFFYLFQLRTVDYAAFGLSSGKYTDYSAGSAVRAEKGLPVQDAPAAAPAPATVTQ
ncbi:family A G protein-coupled receptor-like protein [Phanerochaete sordida]|uniref:Family A G protein-coupled receptor-like protein n=1 Tax=Phanerochaete sordida TaxID=48140 RepID=A0A9P3G3E9_9APHY|nr:family A G protein-coupled receptor-like protein [Phanerochaete sordida]